VRRVVGSASIPILLALVAVIGLSVATVRAEEPVDAPPPIVIGAEPDYPPYSFLDEEGSPTGFSLALFEAAAAAMGRDVDVRPGLWSDIRADLAAGRLDALPLVGRTPEREEIFDFTVPYVSLYGGIVIRENEDDIRDIGDLAGRRVAVMRGDNAEEFLRRQETEFEIVLLPTFLDALELLADGGADAVVMQRLVALRLLREEAIPGVRLVEEPIAEFRQDFCFAVPEGERELLALLNEGLALVIADGTYRRLQTEWFAAMDLPGRRLIVGGDYNYPPFEYLDGNGRPAGYNVDLVRAIADELEIAVEFRLGPWDQITRMLEGGELDLIMGMLYSPERDRTFDFSPSHTVHHQVAIGRGRVGAAVPTTPDGLRGARIAVQAGDIMHGYALDHSLEEDLVVVDSQEAALRLVAEGEVDYALASRIAAMYLIARNGWDNLVVGREGLASHEYGFAVQEGNGTLLSYFTEGLAVIEDSGEYRRIYDRWLGVYQPMDPSTEESLRVIVIILLPVLLVLLGTILWNRSLRRQVRLATAELRERENLFRLLSENTLDVVWRLSPELRISYVNPAIGALTGRSRDEWIGRTAADLFDEDIVGYLSRLVEDSRGDAGPPVTRDEGFRMEGRMPAGEARSVEVGVSGRLLWNDDGTLDGLQGVARDITDRKEFERTLLASIAEKETLLKEVHHRVKNNLNVIVSLLRLQEDHIGDVESARAAFRESRNRIFSMALVHEALYRSDNLAEIELDGYLRDLLDQLRGNVADRTRVEYRLDLDPLTVDIACAVPCGIIVNELVTNAQKHAFAGRESGEIAITLGTTRRPDGEALQVALTVADDGVGLPSGYNPMESKSLGLKLVSVLVEQIDGTWSMVNAETGGTSGVVRFEVAQE
jgi:PAS domain S-box-containing protein